MSFICVKLEWYQPIMESRGEHYVHYSRNAWGNANAYVFLYYSCCISGSIWCCIMPKQFKNSNKLFFLLFLPKVNHGLNLQKTLD